jgi:hypothetical protein
MTVLITFRSLFWILCFLVLDGPAASDSPGSAIGKTKTNYFLIQCKYNLNGLEAISTDKTQAEVSYSTEACSEL